MSSRAFGHCRTFVRYAWAFPATLIGVAFAVLDRAGGGRWRIVDGVWEAGGGTVGGILRRMPVSLRFSAITLGHVVIGTDSNALAACRRHERVHVRQYERWGVFFFPLYMGSSVWQVFCGRHPYWYNHFERQAHQEEHRGR